MTAPSTPPSTSEASGPDPLLLAARTVILEHRLASVSLIQRHLKIGYTRALGIMRALEESVLQPAASATGPWELRQSALDELLKGPE